MKALRLARGLTVIEVAEKFQRNRQTIYEFEAGKNEPSLGQLRIFARLVRISMADLLRGVRFPSEKSVPSDKSAA